ncbi:MAG: DUF2851 family protein [Planctomycetes bacterium]|nr:DUF2851 family protein [Planctomycetota bacterium]
MLDLRSYGSDGFSDAYSVIKERLGVVRDQEQPGYEGRAPIRESLVRCIWFGQHIKARMLATEDGTRAEAISPGWWNVEDGPDFQRAEVLFEGRGLVKGDVEVHVFASDWARHGHDKLEAYNSVILHVVMWNDGRGRFVTNQAGQKIPQLALSRYLDCELDELDVDEYPAADAQGGLCQQRLAKLPAQAAWVGQFLDFAGDERILAKARMFSRRLESTTFEQALYEGVMESLGYKNNKAPFLQLARLAPVAELRRVVPVDASATDKAQRIQALLFGIGNLLPSQRPVHGAMDEESRAYVGAVEALWQALTAEYGKRAMDKDAWSFAGSRPANSPPRRIAAMSCLLARHGEEGLFKALLMAVEQAESQPDDPSKARHALRGLKAIFMAAADPFWDRRYGFGGQRLARPLKLIGDERCAAIVLNVVLPLLLAYARQKGDAALEKRLHALYRAHPKLPVNNVTTFMNCRIFGSSGRAVETVTTARRQQGLYQVFKDFCERDDITCGKCAMLLALDAPTRE